MMKSNAILAILLLALICSSVKASPITRIIDGSIAHQYQFPWHASLHITKIGSIHPRYCGGSLISRDFVLTAASCLVEAQSVRVDLGSILFLEPSISQVSTHFVSHNQFNAAFNTNNIGIIRLSTPVQYTNTLRAILFPGLSHANDLYVGQPSFMSGYGVYQTGGNVLSSNLRFGPQTTLTNQECQQNLDSRFVQASSICALANNNQTACFGDMGGPLVIQYQDTWLQIGIASTINPAGCHGPVVYTRLTSYIEWIRAMTGLTNDF